MANKKPIDPPENAAPSDSDIIVPVQNPEIVKEAESLSLSLTSQIQSLTIISESDYHSAGELRQNALRMVDKIKAAFKESKQKAYDSHRSICNLESSLISPFLEIDRIAESSRKEWKRLDTERQLEERRKIDEQIRQDTIKRLQEEKEQREREILAQAATLYKEGKSQEADELLGINREDEEEEIEELPEIVYSSPLPVFSPIGLSTPGLSSQKTTKYRIIDELKVNRPYLSPNDGLIKALIRSLKGRERDAESIIGGIEVYFDEKEKVRR